MNNIAERIKNTIIMPTQTAIWYLGQEGFLFENKGVFIAVDPYLSYYVDKHCSGTVTWKRLYPPPLHPEELNFLDAVLCTHSHEDHSDPETLTAIANANKNTFFIVPAPEKHIYESFGITPSRIIPAYADIPISVYDTVITPIPSAHEEFHTDENGNYRELGYIIENSSGRFFHAGDMCMYDGLIPKLGNVDVALLPINGRDYFRTHNNIIGNFNCEESVLLAKEIGTKLLIPMHYDLYEVNRVSPSVFVNVLERLNSAQKYHCFTPGERYIFMK